MDCDDATLMPQMPFLVLPRCDKHIASQLRAAKDFASEFGSLIFKKSQVCIDRIVRENRYINTWRVQELEYMPMALEDESKPLGLLKVLGCSTAVPAKEIVFRQAAGAVDGDADLGLGGLGGEDPYDDDIYAALLEAVAENHLGEDHEGQDDADILADISDPVAWDGADDFVKGILDEEFNNIEDDMEEEAGKMLEALKGEERPTEVMAQYTDADMPGWVAWADGNCQASFLVVVERNVSWWRSGRQGQGGYLTRR